MPQTAHCTGHHDSSVSTEKVCKEGGNVCSLPLQPLSNTDARRKKTQAARQYHGNASSENHACASPRACACALCFDQRTPQAKCESKIVSKSKTKRVDPYVDILTAKYMRGGKFALRAGLARRARPARPPGPSRHLPAAPAGPFGSPPPPLARPVRPLCVSIRLTLATQRHNLQTNSEKNVSSSSTRARRRRRTRPRQRGGADSARRRRRPRPPGPLGAARAGADGARRRRRPRPPGPLGAARADAAGASGLHSERTNLNKTRSKPYVSYGQVLTKRQAKRPDFGYCGKTSHSEPGIRIPRVHAIHIPYRYVKIHKRWSDITSTSDKLWIRFALQLSGGVMRVLRSRVSIGVQWGSL